MSARHPPPGECANCGAAIPRHASACPECGADERTGWRDNDATRYDGLDLPDEAFDEAEPPGPARPARRQPRRVNGIAWYWWCIGLALIGVLALGALGLR